MSEAQLLAFALTILVEGLTIVVMMRLVCRTWLLKPGSLVLVAVGGTAITHPIGWWVLYDAGAHLNPWLSWSTVELAVILLEAMAYALIADLTWPRALKISLVVNTASALAGLALL